MKKIVSLISIIFTSLVLLSGCVVDTEYTGTLRVKIFNEADVTLTVEKIDAGNGNCYSTEFDVAPDANRTVEINFSSDYDQSIYTIWITALCGSGQPVYMGDSRLAVANGGVNSDITIPALTLTKDGSSVIKVIHFRKGTDSEGTFYYLE